MLSSGIVGRSSGSEPSMISSRTCLDLDGIMQGTVDFLLLAMVQLCVNGSVSDWLSGVMRTEGGWIVERVEWNLVSWTSHYDITVLLHAFCHFRTPATWTSLTAPGGPVRKEYKRRERCDSFIFKKCKKQRVRSNERRQSGGI